MKVVGGVTVIQKVGIMQIRFHSRTHEARSFVVTHLCNHFQQKKNLFSSALSTLRSDTLGPAHLMGDNLRFVNAA